MKALSFTIVTAMTLLFFPGCSKTGSKGGSSTAPGGTYSTTCTWTDCSGDTLTGPYAVLEADGDGQYQFYTNEQQPGAPTNSEVTIRFNGKPAPGTYTVISDTSYILNSSQCSIFEDNSGIISTTSTGKAGDIITVTNVPADSISLTTGAIVTTMTLKASFANVTVNSPCGVALISGALIK
jgi:hypothetical protein